MMVALIGSALLGLIIVSTLCYIAPHDGAASFDRRTSRHLFSQNLTVSKHSADTSDNKVLNIHIVPHTHDDVGWLKTVDQYYFGLNMSIQHASVHDIIDSVVDALLENPSRSFTYVEQKFFSMWWNRQNDVVKDRVRFLIANKQLSFANGGWCMHDEATTHYIGMIDQTTLGHSFLKRELGVIPRVGWQLDPFGHSATQASLLTSKVGFDALYFGRIDYQDLRLRQLEKECEGLWNSSRSLNDTTVFWGLTGSYRGMYGAPLGFCFDVYCDDTKLTEMNDTALLKSIRKFLRLVRVQSDQTRGSHVMLTMGEDFQYQNASVNFENLDKLISTVLNLQEKKTIDIPDLFGPRFKSINIFYSSPDYYTQCKYEEVQNTRFHNQLLSSERPVKFSVKKDDFFPYSDCEHCFWTGYFTSRTGFKRLERVASSYLLAARQIESMLDYTGKLDPVQCEGPIHELEDASGIAQHHDGVSGTAKQHVSNDYSKRLQSGIDAVSACTMRKVKRLLFGTNSSDVLQDMTFCQLLNETKCDVSQKATEDNGVDVYVIVYNSLGIARSTVVHLPVSTEGIYQVARVGNSSYDTKLAASSVSSSTFVGGAPYIFSFDTDLLPPLGVNVFQVTLKSKHTTPNVLGVSNGLMQVNDHRRIEGAKDVVTSNGLFSVTFDGSNGSLKQIKASSFRLNITQTWGYYTSFDSKVDSDDEKKDWQNSGAYIFRPSTPEQHLHSIKPLSAIFQNTSVGMEVQVQYEVPWIKTTTRVMTGLPYLEVEYTVGPIPIDDHRGKEIVTRLSSPIKSSDTFFTDTNGREFMERKRNYRPTWDLNVFEPVAGNYYPVNAAIYIEDKSGAALAVATDRTQGGSSLADGSIELMVQRRTLADDWRGVFEPMNETDGDVTPYPPYGNATRFGTGVVVRGKHRIRIGDHGGAVLARSMMDTSFADPILFVGSSANATELPFRAFDFSGLEVALPPNVMLITRSLLYNETSLTFLIRLGHQYAIGEHEKYSKSVKVDLALCVPGFKIVDVVEMTLSGNQRYSHWLDKRFDWVGGGSAVNEVGITDNSTVVLLPMEIRTFRVTVKAP